MKYQLMYNNAAGEHYVNQWTDEDIENWCESGYRLQEGYSRQVALCSSKDELEKQIRELAGEPIYAVFENRAAGEVFVSTEDGISGNWRGSKYGHFNLVSEYSSPEGAESNAQSRREYFASLDKEMKNV